MMSVCQLFIVTVLVTHFLFVLLKTYSNDNHMNKFLFHAHDFSKTIKHLDLEKSSKFVSSAM